MGDPGTMNGHIDLPKRDSPDLHLVVATHEENLAQTNANSSEWSGALSLDQYLRREEHLANQELTKDGGLTSWMLVYQPGGESKRQVLCGCETIRKKALVGRNSKVEDVTAHGVCSVFCPPEFRGKGYAGRMMTELGKRLEGWQVENGKKALFTVLYSDIGKEFYAARGWQPFPSAHVSLAATSSPQRPNLPDVQLLKASDIPELCTIDERTMRTRLSRSHGSDKSAVALVPDSRTIRWHHAREEFIAKELFNRHPDTKGAVTGEPGSRVWCYWTRVWPNPQEKAPKTLHILRLAIEDESFSDFAPATMNGAMKHRGDAIVDAIAGVFAEAQRQAFDWGMDEVQLWNPTSTTLAAAQSLDREASTSQREEESITSLRWHGEGSWESVEWVCNEKYGWC